MTIAEKTSSPLSINALREDLQVSHTAVNNWIKIFERLYAIFRIPPFGAPKIRAVKKEQKHYHFDWTLVPDMSFRFENLVACALLKLVHYRQDVFGEDIELNYFRDVDGREVDFVLVANRQPLMMIECKWSDTPISPALTYLKLRFKECEAWQISATGTKDYVNDLGIRVAPATKFLTGLI